MPLLVKYSAPCRLNLRIKITENRATKNIVPESIFTEYKILLNIRAHKILFRVDEILFRAHEILSRVHNIHRRTATR